MQHNQGDAGDELPDMLPTVAVDRKVTALAIQRNQKLSLSLSSAEGSSAGEELDLLSYWRILVKRRWTVLGALGIVLASTLVATLLMTPIYRATATLQIERNTMNVVNVQGLDQDQGGWDKDFFQTQYELIKSHSLAQRVASQVNLSGNPNLASLSPDSPWSRLWTMVSRADADVAPETALLARQGRAVQMVEDGLSVEPVRNSRLVRINFDSSDRAIAQRIANAFADGFIASSLERRFDSSSYAKGYLQDRLQELKLKLEDSERKLVEFAQKEQIVGTEQNSAALSEQTLSSLNEALTKARQDRIRAEARWRQAQASRGLSLMVDQDSNSIIKTLGETRAKVMGEYQDKLRVYKPAYPLMQQINGQINEIDRQIASEISSIKASMQAEYLAAAEQESMLSGQLDQTKIEVLDLQGRSIKYNILRRDVDTNRQLYDGLLQRFKEVGLAGGVTTNNISIVDRAEIGARFKPSLTTNLLFALLAGLGLGVLLALGFEYLDDTLKMPEDIEKRFGLGVLGVVPKLRDSETPSAAVADARSAFAESYRSLRTALQFSTDSGVPRCLLVTSAAPGEGKSTTAIVLAQNFAQLGKRVLLIDCDLRNPSLHRQLGIENTNGLTNYLSGAAGVEEIIHQTRSANLSMVPCGPVPPNPAELLMGSKMLSFLTVAVRKYDQIILDGPPILGLADAPILANLASGTLLVVEAGQTRIATIRNALKRLLATRAHVVGVLLSKYDVRQSGYGYGYGDYRYYAYGDKASGSMVER